MKGYLALFTYLLLQSSQVQGHKKQTAAEMEQEKLFLAAHREPVKNCHKKLKDNGIMDLNAQRLNFMAQDLKMKRSLFSEMSLNKRDLAEFLDTDHRSRKTGLSYDENPDNLFSSNTSCLLMPDVTEGPYYIGGEYLRQNVAEDQAGVPFYLDVQIYDTTSCDPLKDIHFEIWHTNATGVYSGVQARGNGNANDDANIKRTYCRGIQKSNSDGVVQFQTIFPGHYAGRAIHIHVLAHIGATELKNGTITGGHVSHVGQFFFDDAIINQVEATSPYSENKATLTPTSRDRIAAQQSDSEYDPFVRYQLLGDKVEDGILGWITVGIDPDVQRRVSVVGRVDDTFDKPKGNGDIQAPGATSTAGNDAATNTDSSSASTTSSSPNGASRPGTGNFFAALVPFFALVVFGFA